MALAQLQGWAELWAMGVLFVCPDTFDYANSNGDFAVTANGAFILGWQLYGDLSAQTSNIPPAPPVQNAGPVFILNIESYNKNLRTSESTLPIALVCVLTNEIN